MLIDVGIVLLSLGLSYLLRFDFDVPVIEVERLKTGIILFLIIRLGGLMLWKTYAGVIRYTSTEDAARIFSVTLLSSAALWIAGLLRYLAYDTSYFLPTSIIVLEFFLTTFLMIAFRLMVKLLYVEQSNPRKKKDKVIIYGAGEAGVITKRTLDRDGGTGLEVVAFIDDDKRKSSKKLEGVKIFHSSELKRLLTEQNVGQVVSSMMNPALENRQKIIDACLEQGVKMLDVPPVGKWIQGELSFRQLRSIPVEDLLEREVIELDRSAISSRLNGKRVLVTGAAGSIGSELVRQIIRYSPDSLVLLDQAESPLHDISLELDGLNTDTPWHAELGDICDHHHLEKLFERFRPEIVFHAAAYKHVPMIEANVTEGVKTNVGGTMNLVDLSITYGVERFVLISTDKAVNPTNVMGASKRIAEMYVSCQQSNSKTTFITTRFGNVLGSNGSVIPRFKSQIEQGGPITVTHPEIERFFMTIPEACELVLEAGAMGQGGEIFVFDMGRSVKIIDLAKKMIKLSGLEVDKDIEIVISGLRPGEKIKEEVLADMENTLPTHNQRILIANTRDLDTVKTLERIAALRSNESSSAESTVALMKELVPEFKSKNSIYQKLDI